MINKNNLKKIKSSIITHASIEDIVELAKTLKERKKILELQQEAEKKGLIIKKIVKKKD